MIKKSLFFIIILFFANPVNALWYDSNWNYKTDNTNVSVGVISFNISNSIGTNNNSYIFCNGHCKTDFSDVIFTCDDSIPVSYWLENITSGKVWVNVTSNCVLNMYYNNPYTTSLSNGTNTFIDFNDVKTTSYLSTKSFNPNNTVYETLTSVSGGGNVWFGVSDSQNDNPSNAMNIKLIPLGQTYQGMYLNTYKNSVHTQNFNASNPYGNSIVRLKIENNITHVKGYINNEANSLGIISTNIPDSALKIGVNIFSGGFYQYWSFVRPFSYLYSDIWSAEIEKPFTENIFIIQKNIVINPNNYKIILNNDVLNLDYDNNTLFYSTKNFLYISYKNNGTIHHKIGIKNISIMNSENGNINAISGKNLYIINKNTGNIMYKFIYNKNINKMEN